MEDESPEHYRLHRMTTSIGVALYVTDSAATLHAFEFEGEGARLFTRFERRGVALAPEPVPAPSPVRDALERYFAGALSAVDGLRCASTGTPFQRAVWTALRCIPAGSTMSYGALAALVGSPKATRAVGLANNRNPIGVVVPCHRVIGADGSLTGYAGGLARKRWLLEHEARYSPRAAVVPLFASTASPP